MRRLMIGILAAIAASQDAAAADEPTKTTAAIFAELATKIQDCPAQSVAKCTAAIVLEGIKVATDAKLAAAARKEIALFHTLDCSGPAQGVFVAAGEPGKGDEKACKNASAGTSQTWSAKTLAGTCIKLGSWAPNYLDWSQTGACAQIGMQP